MVMVDPRFSRPFNLLPLAAIGLLVIFIGWPQLSSSFAAALRYKGQEKAEWSATNIWVSSANCARATGVWLAICEDGKLIPISERAVADDPGHALLLGLFAMTVNRPIDLVDVARLNICLNAAGLVLLTAILLALRCWGPVFVLLVVGPCVFLEWFGTSPHWSFIGLMAMQALLPIALIARERGWFSPPVAYAFIGLGVAAVALGAVVREAIGTSAQIVIWIVAGWAAVLRWREGRRGWSVLLVTAVAFVASLSPQFAVGARDALFPVAPARLVATHGTGHTMYIGLGAVENKFGLHYLDSDGERDGAAAAPDVEFLSPAYFKVMWSLYFKLWREDPLEVARIYFEKFRLVMAETIFEPAPPLWVFLLGTVAVHLVCNGWSLTCGCRFCDKQLALNLVSLALIGLVALQAVLAMPSRYYLMPIGAFMLVMLGVALENLAGWLWRRDMRHFF